jgi:hypothetical protein
LANSCPWIEFYPAPLWTCEAALCAWIKQPGNTWSSFAFIIVGLYLYYRSIREKNRVHEVFALLSFFIGFSSIMAHATLVWIFAAFDFSSQFLLVIFCQILSLNRLEKIKTYSKMMYFVGIAFFITMIPQIFTLNLSIPLYVALGLPAVFYEFLLVKKDKEYYLRLPLIIAFGFFIAAFTCYVLDATKLVCDPHNPFLQLHSAWHVLNAFTIYYISKYFAQFTYKFDMSI